MAACVDCRFAAIEVGTDDQPRFDCHRYPPVFMVVHGVPAVAFAQVAPDDWCGEFQPA